MIRSKGKARARARAKDKGRVKAKARGRDRGKVRDKAAARAEDREGKGAAKAMGHRARSLGQPKMENQRRPKAEAGSAPEQVFPTIHSPKPAASPRATRKCCR